MAENSKVWIGVIDGRADGRGDEFSTETGDREKALEELAEQWSHLTVEEQRQRRLAAVVADTDEDGNPTDWEEIVGRLPVREGEGWSVPGHRVVYDRWGDWGGPVFRIFAKEGGHYDLEPQGTADAARIAAQLDAGEDPSSWEDGCGSYIDDVIAEGRVIRARVDVYADRGTGAGHVVDAGYSHPDHEGDPVDSFELEYAYLGPAYADAHDGYWDILAGSGDYRPADYDEEGWRKVYRLLDDPRVETTWEEGRERSRDLETLVYADGIAARLAKDGIREDREAPAELRFTATIVTSGNSAAVRIPSGPLKNMGLGPGDLVEVSISPGGRVWTEKDVAAMLDRLDPETREKVLKALEG